MKIQVKIEDQVFDVEIADLHARPVLARIGAETFEVWPEAPSAEALPATPAVPTTNGASAPPAARPAAAQARPSRAPGAPAHAVLAPLPGVVTSVAVEPGTTVAVGQPLCVLEAMKMNNTIRAARAGRIAAVRVSVGQAVQHRQVLLEYEAA